MLFIWRDEQNLAIMIHIIGTCHKTQVLSDLARKGALGAVPNSKILAFQNYLENSARELSASVIGEEMTADRISAYGHNSVSIAWLATQRLGITHVFCEPSGVDRKRLGLRAGEEMVRHVEGIARCTNRDFVEVHTEEVQKQFGIREAFWLACLSKHSPETNSVVMVCGAKRSETFLSTVQSKGYQARVHCHDWTTLSDIPCPCCL